MKTEALILYYYLFLYYLTNTHFKNAMKVRIQLYVIQNHLWISKSPADNVRASTIKSEVLGVGPLQ